MHSHDTMLQFYLTAVPQSFALHLL